MSGLSVCLVALCVAWLELASGEISCRNEKNRNVDWFINYKLPKLQDHGDDNLVGRGEAYAYLMSSSRLHEWRLSQRSVGSPSSMLGRTLAPYYDNHIDNEQLTYLFYNDDAPNESGSSAGHTKGVVLFDNQTGIWLIHSIPKFPQTQAYEYPANGLQNGQSILCVTFPVQELNEIGKQLLYNAPFIYESHLSKDVEALLDDDVVSLFSDKPQFVRSPPFTRITDLKSKGRLYAISFAKDNQFGKDLYGDLVAPELEADLFVETWRRGSGTPLSPTCSVKFIVEDVTSIGMKLANKTKDIDIDFSSTEDHSKWAISQDKNSRWVCIGDINRMESQEKRGGGSFCFHSIKAWSAFRSSISETDHC